MKSLRRLIRSAEYYLRTVPFQADPNACTLRVELVNASRNISGSFTVDVKNKPFSTPEHVVKAIRCQIQFGVRKLHDDWTSASTRRISMPVIEFDYERNRGTYQNRFWFSMANKQGFRFSLQLGSNSQTSILTKLGFPEGLYVKPDGHRVHAEKLWTIGDGGEHGGRSLHDQRIRSDEAFDGLREGFERQFKDRNPKQSKEKGKEAPACPSHNLLLAEYLFSLVFISMYREAGATMTIDAAKEVDDRSVDEFTKKLNELCEFDPGFLREVMDFVQEARRFNRANRYEF